MGNLVHLQPALARRGVFAPAAGKRRQQMN